MLEQQIIIMFFWVQLHLTAGSSVMSLVERGTERLDLAAIVSALGGQIRNRMIGVNLIMLIG